MLHIHLFRQGIKKAQVHVEDTIEDFLTYCDAMVSKIREEGLNEDFTQAIAYPVVNGNPDFDKGYFIRLNVITGRRPG